MELELKKLTSVELKALCKAVDTERKRRGRRSPDNHEGAVWAIPSEAVVNGKNGQTG